MNPNRSVFDNTPYAVTEFTNITLRDFATRAPLMFIDKAKISGLSLKAPLITASGGKNGVDFLAWDDAIQSSFAMTTGSLSLASLKMLTDGISEVGESYVHRFAIISLDENGRFEVPKDLNRSDFFISPMDPNGTIIAGAPLSREQFAIFADENQIEIYDGSVGEFYYFDYYSLNPEVLTIEMGRNIEKQLYTLEAATELENLLDRDQRLSVHITFPCAIILNTFDLLLSNVSNNNQTHVFHIMPLQARPGSNESVINIQIIDIEESVSAPEETEEERERRRRNRR